MASGLSCGDAGSSETVASSSKALTGSGVFNDVESPASNTVVSIDSGNCTGTLISPKVVLTAAHCINGFVGDSCPLVPKVYSIGIGADVADSDPADPADPLNRWRRQNLRAATRTEVGGCIDDSLSGVDLALLFLDPHDAPPPADVPVPFIEDVDIRRPSFGGPGPDLGSAGWSSQGGSTGIEFRKAGIFTNFNLSRNTSGLGGLWMHDTSSNARWTAGDSGGPLFVARANGQSDPYAWTRDPIGVLSTASDTNTTWADITNNVNKQWLLREVQDSAVQCGDTATVQGGLYNVLCNHSDRWLAQHGKVRGDFWYGEVDYTVSRTCSDVDGDHWCDEHDNCPFAPNTDQADSNDDGIGDACQLCPCDPGNDQDQDGVCGPTCAYGTPGCLQRCAGVNSFASQIDNCPAAKNHMQENCNVLSEQSNDPSEILGDACDPVPCPQSNDDTETNHQNCTGIPGTNFQYLQCEGFSVHDRADLTPIGAHVRNPPTSDPPPAVVVPTTTTARYCQARTADQSPPPINGPTTFSCRAAGVIKDLQLIEETDGSDPNRPWHGITTRTGGFVTIPPDGTFAQNYGNGQTTSLVWQYQHDLAAWLANSADPTIPLPVGNSSCVGSSQEMFPGGATIATTCLNGTFWFHGATHVGQDNDNTFAGGTFVGSHAAQLANNYDDVVVDDNVIGYCPTTSTNFQIVAQAAIRRSEAASPQPIIIWPAGFPGASRAAFEVRSRPDSEFVVSSPLGVNILQDQGSLIPTQNLASAPSTNCGGTTVDNLLASSFAERRWVSGVEPDVRLGRHPEIVSFAIASDATSVVDSAVLDATTLRSSSTSVCPNCDRDFTSELSVSNAPSPRSTFASFYSHALNAVVVAGGKDASNADLHDVWLYDVDSQAWGQLPPPRVPLGAILDATYSFADQNFYVVDRVADNFALDALRVVRFDRLGRHAEVVKSWPILRRVDLGIVLSLDRDGAPLVTVASALGYRMIRLGSDGRRVTAHLVDTGIGTLGFRPVVSRESYAFLLLQKNGSARVIRKSNLRPCDDRHEDEVDRRDVESCFR